MKKIILSSLAAVAIALSCASCCKSSSTCSTDFILGLDDSFPPMGFRNEQNEIVGYDIDLAKAVCAKLGWNFKAQPIDWDAKEMELDSGNITCIWNGFTLTEERKANMECTPAYMKNAQVAVVRKDSGIASLADLAGRKVGTQTGSSGEECINDAKEFKASLGELVLIDTYLNAFMQLESGAIDAIVMDLIVANDQIAKSGKDFVIVSEYLSPEEYGIAFKKGNTTMRDAVWNALLELASEGAIAPIAEKWLGADISIVGK